MNETEKIPDLQHALNEALNILYDNDKFNRIKSVVMSFETLPKITLGKERYNILHFAIINHTTLGESAFGFPFITFILKLDKNNELINERDSRGKTPLDYAKSAGLTEIIEKITGKNEKNINNSEQTPLMPDTSLNIASDVMNGGGLSDSFKEIEKRTGLFLNTLVDAGKTLVDAGKTIKKNVSRDFDNLTSLQIQPLDSIADTITTTRNKLDSEIRTRLDSESRIRPDTETRTKPETETINNETVTVEGGGGRPDDNVYANYIKKTLGEISKGNIEAESESNPIYIKGGDSGQSTYAKYIGGIIDEIKSAKNIEEYAEQFDENGIMTGGRFRKRKPNPESMRINNEITEKIKTVAPDLDPEHYGTVKYAFYKQVKNENPDMTSMERSEKVKSLITKKNIDKINLTKMSEERKKAYEERLKLREERKATPRPKKTFMKTQQTTTETTSEDDSSSEKPKKTRKTRKSKK